MSLQEYARKRDFRNTPEPGPGMPVRSDKHSGRFFIQRHNATRLHYDFRLEIDGTLKSWAVPKGPSMNPNDKHLAVMVEDHPIEYGAFEGEIPEGEYGAGAVRIWDKGTYEEIGEPLIDQIRDGKITIIFHGKKLKGEFHMVEMKGRAEDEGKSNWLLFKHKDEYADEEWELKPLLKYGSRSQAPSKKKEEGVGARALERLVKQSKKKQKVKGRG
jgi:bifunctional non-homologous end joining protein LigD